MAGLWISLKGSSRPKNPTTPECQVTITPEAIAVGGELLPELRARHRTSRMIRKPAAEYTQEEFGWFEELSLADCALFAQAEEFTRTFPGIVMPRRKTTNGHGRVIRSGARCAPPSNGVAPFQFSREN